MRKPALALLCTACLVTLSACSITGNQESDSSTSAGNSSKPVENNISAGKPVEKAAKAEPKNMEEQVQAWLAEGLIKPTDDPNIWQATKPLSRPEFPLKHEKPVYPEAGYVYNEAGAEAVVKYWEQLFTYMINSGDTSSITQVCAVEVEPCAKITKDIEKDNGNESWIAGYESENVVITGSGIPVDKAYPGEITIEHTYKASTYFYFDNTDLTLTKFGSEFLTGYSNLSFIDEKWQLVYTEAVEQG